MTKSLNIFTGEYVKVPFRTHYTIPDPEVSEHYEEGTSLTVPDQVEPLQVTVRRCLRGEILNLKDPVYDLTDKDANLSIDEKFEKIDITQSVGFDLADVPDVLNSVQAQKRDSEPVAEQTAPVTSEPEEKE